ncbi:membrane glycoprotein US6 [Cercopithecine betaherpesvirus 5]|uniref:Membrane glycoprotein US6 n=1 Tax=Simian cytomegalovirus (strain Colburn) TaxID=50292 RepID=G8XTL2_SCMVC|nr:membrane glycoprotein US6 [Cercopithecine betaherpesvirus 5]AEV80504.1 membrane glycoprotein US6 [Cercopithecine betaherpesvirus 5]
MKPLCTPCGINNHEIIIGLCTFLLAFSGVASAWSNDTKLLQRTAKPLTDNACTRAVADGSAEHRCPLVDQGPAFDAFVAKYRRAVELFGCDVKMGRNAARGIFGCPKPPKGVFVLLEHYGGLTLVLYMSAILCAVALTALMLYIMEDVDFGRHLRRCGSH